MYVYNTISIPINLNSISFLAAHSMQENDVMTKLIGKETILMSKNISIQCF